MRMSQHFGKTLREAPSDVEVDSHKFLLRSGCIRQLGTGVFSYLPLGWRVVEKVSEILREEMRRIGGQELRMPVVNTADIWKASGRWDVIGPELTRFKDRQDRDLVLAMTHEEAVSDLVRQDIRSYRQLPRLVFHLQTKWRDDPRPRAGLIRVREFTMKDSYSLDRDDAGLDLQYDRHFEAYHRIFARCGLNVLAVKSDVGMMGGKVAHEFMYMTPVGEDTIITCPACGFRANRQVAAFKREEPEAETLLEIEEVATPGASTIAELEAFLEIPTSKTAKAVFMVAEISDEESKLVFAVIRGDLEVNETKLANATGARSMRPAHAEEISAVGAVAGYASPVGLAGVLIVADHSIVASPNLVAGANREGYHLKNVNYGRDFSADLVTDIAAAEEGFPCPECGGELVASRGVEVGNIFKLGTRYSESMNCSFLDEDGKSRPVVMGSYGIGVGRLIACIAEQYNDESGLVWPMSVAPYQVHLVALKGGVYEADRLYESLLSEGIEVLYDDREERPGVMFNDADLMGIPIRLTVSKRSLEEDSVETKLRNEADRGLVSRGDIIAWVKEQIGAGLQPLTEAADAAPKQAD